MNAVGAVARALSRPDGAPSPTPPPPQDNSAGTKQQMPTRTNARQEMPQVLLFCATFCVFSDCRRRSLHRPKGRLANVGTGRAPRCRQTRGNEPANPLKWVAAACGIPEHLTPPPCACAGQFKPEMLEHEQIQRPRLTKNGRDIPSPRGRRRSSTMNEPLNCQEWREAQFGCGRVGESELETRGRHPMRHQARRQRLSGSAPSRLYGKSSDVCAGACCVSASDNLNPVRRSRSVGAAGAA
jgi:hypothetical protein